MGTDRKLDVAAGKLYLRYSCTGPFIQICMTLKELCEPCDYGQALGAIKMII